MSPTQRSKAKLKADGWPLVQVVEHWNSFARIRQDLFGFADIIAVRGDEVLLVQTTSGSNVSARIDKIGANPAYEIWLKSPHRRIEVHGWAKRGQRGKRKVWTCRVVDMTLTIGAGLILTDQTNR